MYLNNIFFSPALGEFAERCKESMLIDNMRNLIVRGGRSPEALYARGFLCISGVRVMISASTYFKYLVDGNGEHVDSFSFEITDKAVRYMLQEDPSLKRDVIYKVIKQNDPFLHYLSEEEQDLSICCILDNFPKLAYPRKGEVSIFDETAL